MNQAASYCSSLPHHPNSGIGEAMAPSGYATQIADPRWANVGILRWANIGNVRWANVILLVGPSLAQHVDPTLGQRWQIIIQRWANVGK